MCWCCVVIPRLPVCTNVFSSDVKFVNKLYAGFIRSGLVVVEVTLLGDWSIILVGVLLADWLVGVLN